ncbi:hypothetical protein BT69DRAFT_551097 [Atractiella rhizophila]|nr:hypothetical protein BT69DRAFT_551097 [Atractiella rhizophila]
MASFAATLAEAPPAQAFSKAQGLVRSTLFFISNDLAQSLADRLNAERIYCDALVTRTPPKSKLPKEFANLPPLPPFLQSLKASLCVQEVQSIQSVHDKFRGRIEAEVFGPLRAFGNGPEWDRLRLVSSLTLLEGRSCMVLAAGRQR